MHHSQHLVISNLPLLHQLSVLAGEAVASPIVAQAVQILALALTPTLLAYMGTLAPSHELHLFLVRMQCEHKVSSRRDHECLVQSSDHQQPLGILRQRQRAH